MKRRLRIVCVFLLLGAIVNVAVAWGCSLWVPLSDRHGWYPLSLSGQLPVPPYRESFVRHGFGATAVEAYPSSRNRSWNAHEIPAWSLAHSLSDADFRQHVRTLEQARGWPLLSLYWYQIDWPGTPTSWRWALALGSTDEHLVPLHPLWPGFAINTVFYATVLWLLFAAPFALRRRRRIKRGLCPKCAYDLRGSASQTCPECGTALARKIETSTSPNVQRNDSTIEP